MRLVENLNISLSFDHCKLKRQDLCLHWRALVIFDPINMCKLIPIVDQLLDKKVLLIYFFTFQVLSYTSATSPLQAPLT